jgi:hypothetical protein
MDHSPMRVGRLRHQTNALGHGNFAGKPAMLMANIQPENLRLDRYTFFWYIFFIVIIVNP